MEKWLMRILIIGFILSFLMTYGLAKSDLNEHSFLLLPFTVFLILSVLSIVTSHLQKKQEIKNESNLRLKQQEMEQKKDWEKFQYELYRKERDEKKDHNRLQEIINNLDSKVDPKDVEIKSFKESLCDLNAKKENTFIVEFTKNINIKKIENGTTDNNA